jgi:tripartite motif-containing protein 59
MLPIHFRLKIVCFIYTYHSSIHMATNQKVTVENLITCAVCQELFDDPRLVPCSHTYCYKCIEQMASANGNKFECPIRDGCIILKKNIDSLPLNRAIRDLVELYGQ